MVFPQPFAHPQPSALVWHYVCMREREERETERRERNTERERKREMSLVHGVSIE